MPVEDVTRTALTELGLAATAHVRTTRAATVDLNSSDSDSGSTSSSFLLLVPGSGFAEETDTASEAPLIVPSGLWSTKKFASAAGLDVGTMLPYVKWALEQGVRPVVLRGNSEAAIASALDSTVAAAPHATVAVVAHSEGGASLVRLIRNRPEYFQMQQPAPLPGASGAADGIGPSAIVRCCVLLDSVHSSKDLPAAGSPAAGFLSGSSCGRAGHGNDTNAPNCINWVQSNAPLDSLKPKPWTKGGLSGGCAVRSAGTSNHLRVPFAAMPSALAFLHNQLRLLLPSGPAEQEPQS